MAVIGNRNPVSAYFVPRRKLVCAVRAGLGSAGEVTLSGEETPA